MIISVKEWHVLDNYCCYRTRITGAFILAFIFYRINILVEHIERQKYIETITIWHKIGLAANISVKTRFSSRQISNIGIRGKHCIFLFLAWWLTFLNVVVLDTEFTLIYIHVIFKINVWFNRVKYCPCFLWEIVVLPGNFWT